MADNTAKASSEKQVEPISISQTETQRKRYQRRTIAIVGMRKQRWESCKDKLIEIKSVPEMCVNAGNCSHREQSHREQVVISRIRLYIEHIFLTHGYRDS